MTKDQRIVQQPKVANSAPLEIIQFGSDSEKRQVFAAVSVVERMMVDHDVDKIRSDDKHASA
jgi:hypothetical protein